MIASGGCTAAYLATHDHIEHLHLIDANPAQLALAQGKLDMLRHYHSDNHLYHFDHMLGMLGYVQMEHTDREHLIGNMLRSLELKIIRLAICL